MQEKEQKQFDKDAQKKALIGNGIILFVLVIGIILAVFCWFSLIDDNAKARGVNIQSVDNYDIRFNTYPGEMQNNGTIVYNEAAEWNMNNDDFDEAGKRFKMFPGEKKYFKTVISNYDLSNYTGSLVFQNIVVNKELVTTQSQTCINFVADLGSTVGQQSYDLAAASDYSEAGVISNTKKIVHSQPIYKQFTLAAATNGDNGNRIPSQVTVYWYVTLNGDAVDNDMMGEDMMKFNSIRFVVE